MKRFWLLRAGILPQFLYRTYITYHPVNNNYSVTCPRILEKKEIIFNSHGDTMYLCDFLNFRGNYRGFVPLTNQVLESQKSHIWKSWPEASVSLTNTRNTASLTLSMKLGTTRAWKVVTQFACGISDRYLNCLASIQIMNLSHLSLWGVLETHLSLTKVAVWCKGAFEHPCQCVKAFSFLRR